MNPHNIYPHVRFAMPDGSEVALRPGDIIGRSDRAALCLNEPYVSEAHAMISLREGELHLLGLRGRFSVDGKPSANERLRRGQRIVLASRMPMTVSAVILPTEVLALESDDFAPQVLPAVSSLSLGPPPRLVGGFAHDADAYLWSVGTQLYARAGAAAPIKLVAGDALTVAGRSFRITLKPFAPPPRDPTWESADVNQPLHFILRYDAVHIVTGGRRATLDGISARLISELAAIGAPVAWQEMARLIWSRDTATEAVLRERWDSCLARLRKKLQVVGVRTDLVHASGDGLVALQLWPGDTIEDHS